MLEDTTALVTGASQGIGETIATTLGGYGASVVCAARSAGAIEETAAAVEAAGGEAVAVDDCLPDAAGDGESGAEGDAEGGVDVDAEGPLAGTPAFVGCSDVDPHIPEERVHETTAVLEALGADADERIYEGMGHGINEEEVEAASALVASLV